MWNEQLHQYLLFAVPTSHVQRHHGLRFAHTTEKGHN